MKKSGYISKAACRGFRPRAFSSYGGRQREHLIARLMRERQVARFVVAPFGYGKTYLAIEYAETVFSWVHVFWLNAQSPCFIRDLDDRDVASECLECDKEAKLVVIDELPMLDAARVELLSAEIDALLKAGCEVIVTCAPPCDLLGSLQRDRLRIGAPELLLNDEELDAARDGEARLRMPAAQVPAAFRVPLLVWGKNQDSPGAFVSRSLGEELPGDLLLAAACAFVLRRGALSDLALFGPIDRALVEEAFGDYPHFGFDVDADCFEAPVIDVEVMQKPLKARLDAIVVRSAFEAREQLIAAWADWLVGAGASAERACDVVRLFCPVPNRAAWLMDHAVALAKSGCFYPWLKLLASLRDTRHASRPGLVASQALCCRMLGDVDGAVIAAKRCAFDGDAPSSAKTVGLLVLARNAPAQLSARASDLLAERARDYALRRADGSSWWDDLALAWDAHMQGAADLASAWRSLAQAGASRGVLCIVASWLFAEIAAEPEDALPCDIRDLREVERYVRQCFSPHADDPVDFLVASAGLSMEAAHLKGMSYSEGPLKSATLMELSRVEASVLMQKRRFEQDERLMRIKHPSWSATPAREGVAQAGAAVKPAKRAVPTLEMRFFGRFDVAIGGVPVEDRLGASKNARNLLVLLAVNRGRDLQREAICESMWPSSDPTTGRKNFYTVWAQLRRALSLEDGTCPYLLRHKYGCRLEEHYFQCDVARLEDICRELLFGKVDFDSWARMYIEIDRDFAGDLLPGESSNELIIQERRRFRSRLTDALVAATQRLVDEGSPQWGTWFARAALSHERTREDAYVALMRAQIADDQRTAAMDTYLECRRVLADELGIDPSPEVDELYRSLLGDC